MTELIRQHKRWFLGLTGAALALRLYFVLAIPVIQGDSLVYANIAKTLLNTGIYGLTDAGIPHATFIRLPGYPLFLAAIFRVFGQDNFTAVMLLQVLFDLATCYIVADFARRTISARAALITYALAAVCPFTANYCGTPLTETLSIFFTALAFLMAQIAFERRLHRYWMGCGAAISGAILLRPDGGILMGAIGLAMISAMVGPFVRGRWTRDERMGKAKHLLAAGTLVVIFSFLPLVPWAARNWRTFHVFQPLVRADATDPGEWEPAGWNHWLQTWMVDYSSIEDISFHVSGEAIDAGEVPDRAFSDAQEKQQVAELFARYNANDNTMTPELDVQFAAIAARHEREHPLRVRVLVPAGRLIATWLRPRTEMLPLDTHWWRWQDDPHDSAIAIALMLLNFLLVAIAFAGVFAGPPSGWMLPLLLYTAVRSLFLAKIGAAEPRYVLECYPAVFVFAARFLASFRRQA